MAYRALSGGKESGIILYDPDGKVIWQGGNPHKGAFFYQMPGNPPIPYHDLKSKIEPHLKKGLLGGLDVPAQAKPVAEALKAGNLAAAQAQLASLGSSGPTGEFKKALAERLEELRKQKRALFSELAQEGKAWEAYKAGQSYVRCFPKADDLSKVKSELSALQSKPEVRQNLSAKQAFAQVAPLAYGRKAKTGGGAQVAAAIDQIAKKYGDTELGKYLGGPAK